MQRHVEHLFIACMHGCVELAWTDPDDGAPRHANLFGLDRLDELVERAAALNGERRNTYIGAALKETVPPFGRSNGVDFLAATALWADLDDPGGTVRASNRYRELGVPPTLVVITGTKPHQRAQLWWKLDEAATEAAQVKALLGGVQRALGSDATVVDPVQIMRLGGTVAWPVKIGRIVEVTEVQLFPARRAYGVARLAAAFSAATSDQPGPGLDIGGEFDGADIEALIATSRLAGKWHTSILPVVASWVSRGWTDYEINLTAPALTMPAWTTERTLADLAPMIAGAHQEVGEAEPGRRGRSRRRRVAGALVPAVAALRRAPPLEFPVPVFGRWWPTGSSGPPP